MNFKIKEFRKEQKLSQGELAKRSGISRTTISGLESGSISVTTTKTLTQIAHALGKEVSDIFLNSGGKYE